MKTETWLGHTIRFVDKQGEWWAVLADVTKALGLSAKRVNERLPKEVVSNDTLQTTGGLQKMLIVNELGIYKTIFQSRKPEAEAFQDWTFQTLKTLRQSSGLEGFQIFRMLDKEHQRESMGRLCSALRHPVRVDFIKANCIANKAISNRYGAPKMLKKAEMTPSMLVDRQHILEETVDLMSVLDRFDIPVKVSDSIYKKYNQA